MTIKKQWIIVMVLISILAIAINSLLFSMLINRDFVDFVENNYQENIKEIQDYAQNVINNNDFKRNQIQIEMQKYLDDPIIAIDLYDVTGQQIFTVEANGIGRHGNMMMMGRNRVEERDSYDILEDGKNIGTLIITRQGAVKDSYITIEFQNTLWFNSILSGILVLIIAIIISLIISKKTSKVLMDTAEYAKALDVEEEVKINRSKINEIAEIQNSLQLLSTKLRLKQKGRKQKVDMIIHQSRTPLTILKSHIEGSIDDVVEMDKNRLDNCMQQVDKLTDIMTHLNEMIEVEQETKGLNITNFDVVELCKKIIRGLKLQFDNKNVLLQIHDSGEVIVTTDEYILSEAIYNLISNAYKFTTEGCSVDINITKIDDNRLVISVQDNGIGIPKGNLPHLFDPYYRSSNVGEIKGQGLGLFIAKNNIERINGQIEVTSKLGEGTTFLVTLPIHGNYPQFFIDE